MSFLWKKFFGDDSKKELPKAGVVEESSSSSLSATATDTNTTATNANTTSSSYWKVVRVAVKNREERVREGGDLKSPQRKIPCESLIVLRGGVHGRIVRPSRKLWNYFDTGHTPYDTEETITDHNHYRTQGHGGRFEARTHDRAVSDRHRGGLPGPVRCGYRHRTIRGSGWKRSDPRSRRNRQYEW